MKREVTPDGVIAQLQIASAEASDSGAYFCQASNLYGREQQLVQLLVQGRISYRNECIHIIYKSFVNKRNILFQYRATTATKFFRNCYGCQSKH